MSPVLWSLPILTSFLIIDVCSVINVYDAQFCWAWIHDWNNNTTEHLLNALYVRGASCASALILSFPELYMIRIYLYTYMWFIYIFIYDLYIRLRNVQLLYVFSWISATKGLSHAKVQVLKSHTLSLLWRKEFLWDQLRELSSLLTTFLKNIYLFIFWLCWVFVSVRGLSLVAASGGHSSSRCAGLSLSRPLLLRSTGSRHKGSVTVAHGPSCSAACGIFPDQGSNPCPLH